MRLQWSLRIDPWNRQCISADYILLSVCNSSVRLWILFGTDNHRITPSTICRNSRKRITINFCFTEEHWYENWWFVGYYLLPEHATLSHHAHNFNKSMSVHDTLQWFSLNLIVISLNTFYSIYLQLNRAKQDLKGMPFSWLCSLDFYFYSLPRQIPIPFTKGTCEEQSILPKMSQI